MGGDAAGALDSFRRREKRRSQWTAMRLSRGRGYYG